jgi:hypothetical protein
MAKKSASPKKSSPKQEKLNPRLAKLAKAIAAQDKLCKKAKAASQKQEAKSNRILSKLDVARQKMEEKLDVANLKVENAWDAAIAKMEGLRAKYADLDGLLKAKAQLKAERAQSKSNGMTVEENVQ